MESCSQLGMIASILIAFCAVSRSRWRLWCNWTN